MHVHDVLIIGAGPAGLAVAARLHEHTPSATFTDDEHQRYHWIRKHRGKANIKSRRSNKDILPNSNLRDSSVDGDPQNHDQLDLLVFDADGTQWMSKWDRLFQTFGIRHLRSPMFFQVDPHDRDALLSYAHETGREGEVRPLPGCVGKEVSKHRKKKRINSKKARFLGQTPDVDERERKDYFVPSTELFAAHCRNVVRKYGLDHDRIQQERVVDIKFDCVDTFLNVEHDSVISHGDIDDSQKLFRVNTCKGSYFAHVVILSIGAGSAPSIPPIPGLQNLPQELRNYGHALQLTHYPPKHVQIKINANLPTSILIVGGGLTSVQLADIAVASGVTKVYLLMRGPVKVKYFDVDLEWVGKFRNFKHAEFWSADSDEERMEMLLAARNGGSITPSYRKILDAHIASGKISLHTYTTLTSVAPSPSSPNTINITTSPPTPILPPMDHITFATSVVTSIDSIPCLQSLQSDYPIPKVKGLPCLTDDLAWRDDVPLFVTGRLAGLRLGPGAANLGGMRIGAERVAWNVADILDKTGKQGLGSRSGKERDAEGHAEANARMDEYAAARGNRFEGLNMEGE